MDTMVPVRRKTTDGPTALCERAIVPGSRPPGPLLRGDRDQLPATAVSQLGPRLASRQLGSGLGLGFGEAQLPIVVSQPQQLLVRNQVAGQLLAPEETVFIGPERSHAA